MSKMANRTGSGLTAIALAVLLTACTTTSGVGTGGPLSTTIDMSALPGWDGTGKTGIYACLEPVCSNTTIVAYETRKSSPAELDVILDVETNRERAREQFEHGFKLLNRSRRQKIEPDGELLSTEISGRKAVGMQLKATKANGAPRDPVYMLMVAGNRNLHIFAGSAASKREAKAAVHSVAGAWRP